MYASENHWLKWKSYKRENKLFNEIMKKTLQKCQKQKKQEDLEIQIRLRKQL